MKNILFAGAAALTLAGCADQKGFEEYSQNGFLAATQEIIDGTPTTVEFFDEDQKNQLSNTECSLDPKLLHESNLPTHYVLDDTKEMVIACLFKNED